MDVELISPPDSYQTYQLNAAVGTSGRYAFLPNPASPVITSRRLAVTLQGEVFTAPFQSIIGGCGQLGPLNVAPILLLFSNSTTPKLGNSFPIWLPSGCTFGFTTDTTGTYPILYPTRSDIFPVGIISTSPVNRNGGFETAGATPPAFANWNQTTAGASTVTRDLLNSYSGAACCLLTVDAGGNLAQVGQPVLSVGRRYRYSFACQASAAAIIRVSGGNGFIRHVSPDFNAYYNYVGEFTAGATNFTLDCVTALANVYLDNVRLLDVTDDNLAIGFRAGPQIKFELQNDFRYWSWYVTGSLQPTIELPVLYGSADGDTIENGIGQAFLTLKGTN